MSKIKYNPELTIEEISRNSGVSEAAVRKYIRENFIDREYDSQLIKFRRVQQYFRDNPDSTNTAAAVALGDGYSRNTVEKYRHVKNAPRPNGDKIYLTLSDPTMSKATVATVSDHDRVILGIILRLYMEGDDRFDCDLTFSKGDFYRYGIQYPRYCFDLYPEQPEGLIDAPEVKPLDAGYEIPDNTLGSVVIDLPQRISEDGLRCTDSFQSVSHLALSYYRMLKLAYCKLRYLTETQSGGLLIIKVGDIMWQGKMLWMSKIVTELATGQLTRISALVQDALKSEAEKNGSTMEAEFPLFDLELVDKYVHTYDLNDLKSDSPNGHSIKAHDYFLVFRKGKEPRNFDALYYGTDSESDNVKDIFAGNDGSSFGPTVVSRKSRASGNYIIEVRMPQKNMVRHIDKQLMVDEGLKNAVSMELDVSIPFYAYRNGEQFLKFLKEVVAKRLLDKSATDPKARRIPSSKEIDTTIADLLRKCGVKFIQWSVGDKRHPEDYYRTILDSSIVECGNISKNF